MFRDGFVSAVGEGPEMVVLPRGSFTMGSPSGETGRFDDEGPQRSVRIGYEFAVGRYEVTVDEYRIFATETGRGASEGCTIYDGRAWKDTPSASWQSPGFLQAGNHPVTCVSWDDAQAYVTWLNQKTGLTGGTGRYRLLSEAEWEYAARAGSSGPYPWGSSASRSHANYGSDTCCSPQVSGDDRWEYTSPAGSFPANGFGLHDLHGNVWEWAEDCYTAGYSSAPSDGSARTTGDCSTRVLRGGSWDGAPQYLRSADRGRVSPGSRGSYLGFRLARTLPP
jgi:formylglycine-generating enzyme required for sulfatase activity